MKTILHPTDFSPSAQAALPIARSLARDYGAKLILLYVRPEPVMVVGEFGSLPPEPPESDETIQAKLRYLAPADAANSVEYIIRDGDATREILAASKQIPCDMIVLGTHGRSGLRRLIMGSVAEAIMRMAPCPVLTVKAPVAEKVSAPAPAEPEPSLKDSDLATVYSVGNPAEAEVIKNALQREGIRCFLENEHQAGIAGTSGFPIKIQVSVDDAARAGKFIQHHAR